MRNVLPLNGFCPLLPAIEGKCRCLFQKVGLLKIALKFDFVFDYVYGINFLKEDHDRHYRLLLFYLLYLLTGCVDSFSGLLKLQKAATVLKYATLGVFRCNISRCASLSPVKNHHPNQIVFCKGELCQISCNPNAPVIWNPRSPLPLPRGYPGHSGDIRLLFTVLSVLGHRGVHCAGHREKSGEYAGYSLLLKWRKSCWHEVLVVYPSWHIPRVWVGFHRHFGGNCELTYWY